MDQHSLIVNELSDRFRKAMILNNRFVALHEPSFQGNEWNYVKDCLDTGWVSSVGQYVNQFEVKLAEWTGSPYAVAVMNGTAALHVALLLAGVEPGVEVLVPSLTFIATINAVRYCSAIPHFIDVSRDTMGIDPYAMRVYLKGIVEVNHNKEAINKHTKRKIAAVIPMHTFGHPVHMDELADVCMEMGIPIVEDAAESLGSYYKGKHTGTFGLTSAISFNGNKVITTGGGGAILTADPALAKRAKHLTTTAKVPHAWEFYHDETGFNYRMPNLNAAVGCAQLEQLPAILDKKRKLAEMYSAIFSDLPGITFFKEPGHGKSNYWLNAIVLDRPNKQLRDDILERLNGDNIMCRPIWTPMHKLPMFNQYPRMDLSITEELGNRIINIPSSPSILDLFNREG